MSCRPVVVLSAALLIAATAHGTAWIRGDLSVGAVFEVAPHPTLPGIAFASTDSGLYRTTDAGAHWQHVADLHLRRFDFNPFRADELCAQSLFEFGLAAYCSADLGLTWSSMPGAGISFLIFDRHVPDRMYSGPGYGNSWVVVSDDHGKTWSIRGFTAGHPNFHAMAASDVDSTIYETSWPHGSIDGACYACPLYRSRDVGVTWELIDGQTDFGGPSLWMLAVDVARSSTLYPASDDVSILPGSPRVYTIRASTDGGTTWQTRGVLHTAGYVFGLAADPGNDTTIYAAGETGVILRSSDGGRSWARIDDGAFAENVGVTVGIDGTVYAETAHAVFASRFRRHAARH